MKKLLILLLILFIPFSTLAAEPYPVLPENLTEICLTRFGFDDTGSRVLYEKVPITGTFNAWMIGWFWDDYKIVIGITDEGDIIYFNRASLSGTPADISSPVSTEEGFESALRFLDTALGPHNLRHTSSKGYTYHFSEYHNGIRVVGHDATVVVDKSTGEVYYYKGFGNYNAEYKILDRMISKSRAFDIYFENSTPELVYYTNFDSISRTKTVRPMYILPNLSPAAVEADSGNITPLLMYDYNYYYSDSYYDPKFDGNNSVNGNEGIFEPADIYPKADVIVKLKNNFYALRMGYSFELCEGFMQFAGDRKIPVLQVNIAPENYSENIKDFSILYDRHDDDVIKQNPTHKEYIFARAYVNADTGEILSFSSLPSPGFKYIKPYGYKNAELPRRVSEFIVRASDKSDELRLYSRTDTGKYTSVYTYARYVNDARVIGEGAVIEFNSYANDITGFYSNMSTAEFDSLEGIKTPSQIAEIMKNELTFGLCYTDDGEGVKKVVYDFTEKQASFDPVSGTRIDTFSADATAQIIICNVGVSEYTVNGQHVTASPPVVYQNKIYMPVRFLGESLGFEVGYADGLIILSSDDNTAIAEEGNLIASVNGKTVVLSDSPVLIGDTVYISVATIRQLFGLQLRWDGETNKIFMIS